MRLTDVRAIKWPVTTLGLAISLLTVLLLLGLDQAYPVKDAPRVSTLVLSDDGTPLRVFPGPDATWRYPINLDEISEQFVDVLLAYEDRWFYSHPGVNPLSMLRAFGQNVISGRRISGGSTLTMQVARLLYQPPRNYWGKLIQSLRALQLEYHYNKREILQLYINLAPYGGMLSGIQAASYHYFSKPAQHLTDAEVALLVVLPQRPSLYRPDRYPDIARIARDKVLERMLVAGLWAQSRVEAAKAEPIWVANDGIPMVAPLLARTLYDDCPDCDVIRSTLDYGMQLQLEDLSEQLLHRLEPEQSLAMLVMDNATGQIKAYVGSADFSSKERSGYVDMIKAVRSPGSTLKPFLYGVALDDGLIHSQSLLQDAPRYKSDYRPHNFSGGFMGPVSATEALQRSLNIPAVQLIEHVGAAEFLSKLQHAGLVTSGKGSQKPNSAIILGGIGVRMIEMAGLYRALARDGQAIDPILTTNEKSNSRYLMSKEAAWIIWDALAQHPSQSLSRQISSSWNLAWKTGTSYGYREAWAFGTSRNWTIGVWVGRPDGSASPGHFGRVTAAPVLFRIYAALGGASEPRIKRPNSVIEEPICWPSGTAESRPENKDSNCSRQMKAWTINSAAPSTLSAINELQTRNFTRTVWLNPETGLRGEPACAGPGRLVGEIRTRWPEAVIPWLSPEEMEAQRLPDLLPQCELLEQDKLSIKITSWPDHAIIRVPNNEQSLKVDLIAEGGSGTRDWYLNGRFIGRADRILPYTITQSGKQQIAVIDTQGNSDLIEVTVDADWN